MRTGSNLQRRERRGDRGDSSDRQPWAYLRDVRPRLCAGETELESLLPDRSAASHPEHVLQHRLDESRRKAARQKATRDRRRARKKA
jgi:transposase